ncbi:VRR-NUC domain-containing protein [Noviherbaspirillum galbum]|uniref:phosphodiesterase I n=1 Tax=Noviherbaspirillum galbum TaxID=2709383 RepID=A0A6B3SW46_9BURK|nr:VRR-NUC domain-containing protein [Noviherbaspirillum galbum]NEX62592.1 VRR-NUC domain-containing protein [Noviherbaspirillum galbum]
MPQVLDNPLYYLDNFDRVIAWVGTRYAHLLDDLERQTLGHIAGLPQPSRALLVRMIMRKGPYFRESKLAYDEIGCTRSAVAPLVKHGWVDDRPPLDMDGLFTLLTKAEILSAFPLDNAARSLKKADLLDLLRAARPQPNPFDAWLPASEDRVYQVRIGPLCDRLKLLFFGNCRQDWTDFVLSDLGIFRYEQVELSTASHAFQAREDVDVYLQLQALRERYDVDGDADAIMADIPADALANPWLESRRSRLLFQLGQGYEQSGRFEDALAVYAQCRYAGARLRMIRVLEKLDRTCMAHDLASIAERAPENEAERQQLERILPRLHRKLGLPKPEAQARGEIPLLALALPQPDAPYSVERVVARHLAEEASPVLYVENTLMTSLFGLLFWDAIFAPVPGAFFHPFQSGPADLYHPDFHTRRELALADCMAQLESDAYAATIRERFSAKADLQSPFVVWPVLSAELIDMALSCIPAAHLKSIFSRILLDLRSNRAGFPDLIQFWPGDRQYRMIEVKAPNDRLQDNQIRWIQYCLAHDIPVSVCHVQWLADDGHHGAAVCAENPDAASQATGQAT